MIEPLLIDSKESQVVEVELQIGAELEDASFFVYNLGDGGLSDGDPTQTPNSANAHIHVRLIANDTDVAGRATIGRPARLLKKEVKSAFPDDDPVTVLGTVLPVLEKVTRDKEVTTRDTLLGAVEAGYTRRGRMAAKLGAIAGAGAVGSIWWMVEAPGDLKFLGMVSALFSASLGTAAIGYSGRSVDRHDEDTKNTLEYGKAVRNAAVINFLLRKVVGLKPAMLESGNTNAPPDDIRVIK